MKSGSTIFDACKKENIRTNIFYDVITKKQKDELSAYRIINKIIKNNCDNDINLFNKIITSQIIKSANNLPIRYFDDNIEEQLKDIDNNVVFDNDYLNHAIKLNQTLAIPEFCWHQDLSVEIKRSLITLTDKEQQVLIKYFGLDCVEMTLEEIAKEMYLSRNRVRQIKEKALRRLSHPSRIKNLKSYFYV